MATFDPNRRCRLHEQLNDRFDDWAPITLEKWRQRMKWHDPAKTVMDWDGLGAGRAPKLATVVALPFFTSATWDRLADLEIKMPQLGSAASARPSMRCAPPSSRNGGRTGLDNSQ